MHTAELSSILHAHWGIDVDDVQALTGGMNSQVWEVRAGGRRWAAKLVGQSQLPCFRTGLAAATVIDAGGIPAGVPMPTLEVASCVNVPGGGLALLAWVDGVPLVGDEDDQRVMGDTLAAAHAGLAQVDPDEAPRFHWIDSDAAHLDVEGWVRPAVRAALTELEAVVGQSATYSLLHGDPAPEAFLWSSQIARCGLIDWSSAFYGPLLYDLASAVMYVGGHETATPSSPRTVTTSC